ncbi:MAG: helix-turn-helix domain-containing protein [Candidatus Poribacteria bacterium]
MASIGEQLKQVREDKNISLDDVANATKISKRYLQAIEEGNYSLLPAQTYVKGCIYNYARYLGLDPKSMVEQYSKLILPKEDNYEPITTMRASHRNSKKQVARKRVVILLVVIIFLILCLAGLVFWYGKQLRQG